MAGPGPPLVRSNTCLGFSRLWNLDEGVQLEVEGVQLQEEIVQLKEVMVHC